MNIKTSRQPERHGPVTSGHHQEFVVQSLYTCTSEESSSSLSLRWFSKWSNRSFDLTPTGVKRNSGSEDLNSDEQKAKTNLRTATRGSSQSQTFRNDWGQTVLLTCDLPCWQICWHLRLPGGGGGMYPQSSCASLALTAHRDAAGLFSSSFLFTSFSTLEVNPALAKQMFPVAVTDPQILVEKSSSPPAESVSCSRFGSDGTARFKYELSRFKHQRPLEAGVGVPQGHTWQML